jgi:hypothetical protein
MLFRLKSASAMYQRGIERCLHTQLERNAEAYIDDVVVKNLEDEVLLSDLAETLDNLRKFKMKLNPEDLFATASLHRIYLSFANVLPNTPNFSNLA